MQEAVYPDERQRSVADVELKQPFEEPGVALEDVEGSIPDASRTVHEKQDLGHEGGKTLDAAVSLLIGGEVIGLERRSEGCGLAEAESETFAGDGVDRTGGVAYEGDVAAGDTTQGTTKGDGGSWRAVWFCCD